ncbi:MAG: hypothetical protein RIS35_65 [Pseudomonadota bacterium]|jgi:crotonobetainyl-CoA:carnitine CoA-transferase CaiB-like acyl-CoA transferase
MSYEAPFKGLKVVDLSQGIAGPYAAMLLAQHGADVIKVEGTGDGDWSRALGARYGDHSAFSVIGNLGKRSVALDLKEAEGKAVLWRLLEGADVFIEGFRPGVIKRLGFDWETVSARVPRIVYLSISGFGQQGPLIGRPAMDPVLQAFTGMTAENAGEDGIPHRVPFIPVDMTTALYAFQALSATLYARRDEPRGRYLEASLMQAGAAVQAIRMMQSYLEGGTVKPGGVPQGVFRTADGWMTMTAPRDHEWLGVCRAIGRPELAHDDRYDTAARRFANEAVLLEYLRGLFVTQPFAYWSERFTEHQVMHERVNRYSDFLEAQQPAAIDLIAWLAQPDLPREVPVARLPGIPRFESGAPLSTSPRVGEHTAEVLAEHGFTVEEIDGLAARGVVDLGG